MRVAQNSVEAFMKKIPFQAKNLPAGPTIPPLKVRLLRAKLMLEECLETINKGLGLEVYIDEGTKMYQVNISELRFEAFDDTPEPDIVEIADGLADQLVVVLGTAITCGIQMSPIFYEVMENNKLKLENGSINEDGKLVKVPNHPRPRVEYLIERQILNAKSSD